MRVTQAEILLMGIPVFVLGGLTGVLKAQSTSGQSEQFEVASIRPSPSDGIPSMEFTGGGGVRATNVTLKLLIQIAYDIRPEQISGGLGWTDSDQYTVVAKGPEGGAVLPEAAQQELVRKRLQALLTERFHLALKREVDPSSGYILTVEKKGHTMTVPDNSGTVLLRQVGRWEIRAEWVQMSMFARFLSVHLQATVEDRTGLVGGYTFHLKWNPELRNGQSVRSFDGLPEDSLIPAVREQLGLRLERQTVPTDRYTIERAEKPTEN
jgi:bla regulator protein BlaR1